MELEFHQLDRRWEHLRAGKPERQRRLMGSLAGSGQQTPIVVVEVTDQPGRYLVIDGYKRIAALEQMGRDTVEAVVWPMTEAEALVLDRSLRLGERETALEEGWLLAELEQRFGYELDELARRFDRSVGWVTRRLALVELLPESVQQQVREGKISSHIATKFLAPVARISLDDCQRLAEAFGRHRFNTRQASQLYGAWRDGSPVIRQRLLEQPELFLKARRQAEPQVAATAAVELLRDLDKVLAIANRANRRVGQAALEMNRRQCEQVRRQIDSALDELSQLASAIPREEEYVEQRSTDGDSGTRGSGSKPPRDRPGHGNLTSIGAASRWLQLFRGASNPTSGESRALPSGDSRAVEDMQGESGPGP
jgi:ParB family chromosome partitioning protein